MTFETLADLLEKDIPTPTPEPTPPLTPAERIAVALERIATVMDGFIDNSEVNDSLRINSPTWAELEAESERMRKQIAHLQSLVSVMSDSSFDEVKP